MLQLGSRGERAVDEGAAAALALHRPPHHQLRAGCRQSQRREARIAGLGIARPEEGLHFGLLRAGAHRIRQRASPEHQVERVHQDGLPRPRLAGQRIEPGSEVHLELVDDGEGPHPQ